MKNAYLICSFCWVFLIFLGSPIYAQLELTTGPHYTPDSFDCSSNFTPNATLAAIGGFKEAPANTDGSKTVCINMNTDSVSYTHLTLPTTPYV